MDMGKGLGNKCVWDRKDSGSGSGGGVEEVVKPKFEVKPDSLLLL